MLARPGPATGKLPQFPSFMAETGQSLGELLGSGPRGLQGNLSLAHFLHLPFHSILLSLALSRSVSLFANLNLSYLLLVWFPLSLFPPRLSVCLPPSRSPSLSLGLCFSFLGVLSPAESVSPSLSWSASLFCFFVFLTAPRGMWGLSSPTRDRTCAPCIGSVES